MTNPSSIDRVWTVPNMISAARFGLAIALFVLIEQEWQAAATAVFLSPPRPIGWTAGGRDGLDR